MKSKYIVLLLLLLFSSITNYAQTSQFGINNTVDDSENQQISITGNCKFGKKPVQISNFSLHPYIYVTTENGKNKFHQDSFYSVQDCSENIYRIWHQKSHQQIDKETFNIYSFNYIGIIKQQTSRGFRLENKEKTAYYFTIDDNSEIFPLKMINVKLALKTDKDLDNRLIKTSPINQSLLSTNINQFSINSF